MEEKEWDEDTNTKFEYPEEFEPSVQELAEQHQEAEQKFIVKEMMGSEYDKYFSEVPY